MLPRSGRSCGTQGCTSRYAVGALQQHIYKWGADCRRMVDSLWLWQSTGVLPLSDREA